MARCPAGRTPSSSTIRGEVAEVPALAAPDPPEPLAIRAWRAAARGRLAELTRVASALPAVVLHGAEVLVGAVGARAHEPVHFKDALYAWSAIRVPLFAHRLGVAAEMLAPLFEWARSHWRAYGTTASASRPRCTGRRTPPSRRAPCGRHAGRVLWQRRRCRSRWTRTPALAGSSARRWITLVEERRHGRAHEVWRRTRLGTLKPGVGPDVARGWRLRCRHFSGSLAGFEQELASPRAAGTWRELEAAATASHGGGPRDGPSGAAPACAGGRRGARPLLSRGASDTSDAGSGFCAMRWTPWPGLTPDDAQALRLVRVAWESEPVGTHRHERRLRGCGKPRTSSGRPRLLGGVSGAWLLPEDEYGFGVGMSSVLRRPRPGGRQLYCWTVGRPKPRTR